LFGSGTGYLFSLSPSLSCTELGEWFLSLFHLPIIPLNAISNAVLCVIWNWLTYNIKINKIWKGRENIKRKRRKRKRKNKSTGRDDGVTSSEQENYLERKRKKEKKKIEEPKKSTGRDGGLTHSEQDKHLESKRKKKKKNPGSGTKVFRS
jgi:hypothetical protein